MQQNFIKSSQSFICCLQYWACFVNLVCLIIPNFVTKAVNKCLFLEICLKSWLNICDYILECDNVKAFWMNQSLITTLKNEKIVVEISIGNRIWTKTQPKCEVLAVWIAFSFFDSPRSVKIGEALELGIVGNFHYSIWWTWPFSLIFQLESLI